MIFHAAKPGRAILPIAKRAATAQPAFVANHRPPVSLAGLMLACAMIFAIFSPGSARAAETTTVMIIFDGSGSMWGKIDGGDRKKFYLAREAFEEVFSNQAVSQNLAVGTVSYGNRRRSDCSDAAVLTPLETFEADRIVEPLNKLNPKGRGPLTLALRVAAEELPDSENGPGSIIVVHDGVDNCREDPCEFATEFAKSRPDVAIHLVSLGIDKDDLKQISCISERTGGRHFDVEDDDAVTTSIAAAWKLAVNGVRDGRVRRPRVGATSPPVLPDAGFTGAGMVVTAALGPNSPLLSQPLTWTVRASGDADTKPLLQQQNAILRAPLPAGKYIVEAHYSGMIRRKEVIVPDAAPLKEKLVFNAGQIVLTARKNSNGPALAGIAISITPHGTSSPGKARPRTIISNNSGQPLLLPAGSYTVSARQGHTRVRHTVKITAGDWINQDLVFQTGTLRVDVASEIGSPGLGDALVTIHEIDPTAPQGRREVARSSGQTSLFELSAGTYYVGAKLGQAHSEKSIAIRPGTVSDLKLDVLAANLTLSVSLGATQAPAGLPVAYRLIPLDANGALSFQTSRKTPSIVLAPGRYRVESRIGVANALLAYEISMSPGQRGRLNMEHQAGAIQLRLTTSPGGLPLGNVFWQVFNDDGRLLRTTGQIEPQVVLAAGSYLVRAEQRGRKFERKLSISAGSNTTVEVLVDQP